jgi:uncharacterized protein YqhQ
LAPEAATKKKGELLFGGMARWGGLDLFGPNYMSTAYRGKKGEVRVHVEPSKVWRPKHPLVKRLSELPILRSFFFWGRLVVQVVGSFWTLLFFALTMGILWGFVSLLEVGGGPGALGTVSDFFADYPILPMLGLFFAAMRFSSIGRYHGAEHKVVAAYEDFGEVTLENAAGSSRIHPRCGTNILAYIVLAALLDPLISWPGYSALQFILISEAWFFFGKTAPSIAVGNFMQRHVTTTEPHRSELEVAVESLQTLLRAEEGKLADEGGHVRAHAGP